jgi:hypothetical protein
MGSVYLCFTNSDESTEEPARDRIPAQRLTYVQPRDPGHRQSHQTASTSHCQMTPLPQL